MAKVYLDENDDLIDIRHDNVFKAVFTRNTPASQGALSRLISALICKEVLVTTIVTNEPPIDNIRDRQIRFDINCRAKNGELINVEMSFDPVPLEPIRLEFHIAKLFIGQDIKGKNKSYKDLKEAYQITILARHNFFPDDIFLHTFEYVDKKHGIPLNGRSRIITMELSKLDNIVEKPVSGMNLQEYWAVYFRYLTDKDKRQKVNEIMEHEEGIAMANEVLMEISKDEIERARLFSEEKYELDTQSRITYAREQGLQEGLEKGLIEGLDKGRVNGLEEGLEKGARQEKLLSAANLKKLGVSTDIISQATGLSIEEIEKL